jgi:predicted nucleotidyltransferase
MSNWVKYHLEHLKRWREYAEKIAKAVKDLIPEAKVYVIGSIAENRTTIYSDIDILIAIPSKILDSETKKKLYIDIIEKAIDLYQLPWDAPVEIHIADSTNFEQYKKMCRKMIHIETQP